MVVLNVTCALLTGFPPRVIVAVIREVWAELAVIVVGLAVTETLADANVTLAVFEWPSQVAIIVATPGVVVLGLRVTAALPSGPVDTVCEESVPLSVVNETEAPLTGLPPITIIAVISEVMVDPAAMIDGFDVTENEAMVICADAV